MTEHDALDQALSHQAILELGCRYVRGVDRGDPATIMTAFHEDAAIVSGAFNGSAVDFSTEIGKLLDEISPRVAHTVTNHCCLLYTSPSPRDATLSRMPSSA